MMRTFNNYTGRIIRDPFFYVFVTALVIRLAYLLAMAGQIDLGNIIAISPDTNLYIESATAISDRFDFTTKGVLVFGPGWPLFLAVPVFFFGQHSLVLILVQILLSSFGAWLTAQLAYQLIHNKPVAIIAGLFNAISLTSITLGVALLSDTLFFVLVLAGLSLFLRSMETGHRSLSVWAGLAFSWAALTRGVGMFLFIMLILIAITYRNHRNGAPFVSRKTKIRNALLSIMIIVFCVTAWGVRNYAVYGLSHISFSGPRGFSKLICLTRSQSDGIEYDECLSEFAAQAASDAESENDFYRHYNRHVQSSFIKLAFDHPMQMGKALVKNIIDNIHCESELQYLQLPEWRQGFSRLAQVIYSKGLDYRASLLALIGLILLIWRHKYRPALILAFIWIYFALFSGLTLWQGSRIFYPGQIAWGILASYTLVSLWSRIIQWRQH
jgi:hypothetical protein